MRIPKDQITLTGANGGVAPLLGEMRYYGGLYPHVSSIQHTRPGKWKDTVSRPKTHHLIFAVDGKNRNYALRVGSAQATLKTPGQFSNLKPAMIAEFGVTGAKTVTEIPGTFKANKDKYPAVNVALSDTFLKVDITITPKTAETHFFWHTNWFGLKDDLGQFVPVAGEIHGDDLSDGVSHNKMKGSAAEKWKPIPASLYFAVSSKAKHFQLYCAAQPVAEFSIP